MKQYDRIEELATKFSYLLEMQKKLNDGETVAWKTSYNLIEIIDTVDRIKKESLKKIYSAKNEEDVRDAIHDIGENLRHAIYHIENLSYFSYLR